jgi:(1->4)-alpha-D-glucan 1-alpha-D-glucosylmutase
VFEATHQLLLELVREGAVTGLRIDHPDGLYLPREYFEKLQRHCADALGIPLPKDGRAIYMVVEKILTGNEKLPKDWPIHGTTGYEFGNQVAQLLVDASAENAVTSTYRILGLRISHLVYAKKRQVSGCRWPMTSMFLATWPTGSPSRTGSFATLPCGAARAVRETIACFPVYRTYLAPDTR